MTPNTKNYINPVSEEKMAPPAEFIKDTYKGSDKLKGKTAVITGGDSGIGRAIAIHFAHEGANVVISYLKEDTDAKDAQEEVIRHGGKAYIVKGDIGDPSVCQEIADSAVREFGNIDILVNNAAMQKDNKNFLDIKDEDLVRTFETNIFSFFYLTKACLPHMGTGSSIINTTSVTAFRGSEHLVDYSSTKGAIVSFTRSLALNLAPKGIRVNAVAPGPIWTPLVASTFPQKELEGFGKDIPMGRAGQPSEVAPAYVFLASEDASYITGQTIHPNGGEIINA